MSRKVNDSLADILRERSLTLARYETGLHKRVSRQITNIEREVMAFVAGLSGAARTEIESAIQHSSGVVYATYRKVSSYITSQMLELVGVELSHLGAAFNEEIGREIISAALGNTAMAEIASDALIRGATSEEWWAGQAAGLQRKIATAMRIKLSDKPTVGELLDHLKGEALFEGAKSDAKALIRTSVHNTVNQTRLAMYRENADTIGSLQHVSTLDDRTSLICISRDGLRWTLDGKPIGHKVKFAVPPLHWNCRSTLTPVTKSWKELGVELPDEKDAGTRASMDGSVPADIRYEQWLRQKGEEFQNRVLGPTRAALWRSGKMKISQMIDQTGRELRIDELKKRR